MCEPVTYPVGHGPEEHKHRPVRAVWERWKKYGKVGNSKGFPFGHLAGLEPFGRG